MHIETWITDPQNQVLLRRLSRRALSELASEELPVFEEVYPRYVEVAQGGEVALEGERADAFSLSGEASLLLFIVVPVLAGTLAALVISRSLNSTASSQTGQGQREAWPDKENVRAEIDGLLPRKLPGSNSREQVLEVLAAVVIEHFS